MFSVLLSVYSKEKASYLDQALSSIWDGQSMTPGQVVLVKDGPLNEELDQVISLWKIRLGEVLNIVALPQNVGLASALNEGLKICSFEYVARMDTDDIADPDRFSKQYSFMASNPNIAVCSGKIEEWDQSFSKKISERSLPLKHKEILVFSKKRSPISHPAVMYKKSAVVEAGGYPSIYPEDYPLWGKMLSMGYEFANLPDVLLKMRVGNALVERRGKDFFMGEIKVFKYLYSVGLIGRPRLFLNIAQRGFVRLSPTWLKKILYMYFR